MIGAFIEDRCRIGDTLQTTNARLRPALEAWRKTNGHDVPSGRKLGQYLQARVYRPGKNTVLGRFYRGLDVIESMSTEISLPHGPGSAGFGARRLGTEPRLVASR